MSASWRSPAPPPLRPDLPPWHRIDLGILTVSRSGLQSPNGFLGLLAALVVVAILARIVVSEFTTIDLPRALHHDSSTTSA